MVCKTSGGHEVTSKKVIFVQMVFNRFWDLGIKGSTHGFPTIMCVTGSFIEQLPH